MEIDDPLVEHHADRCLAVAERDHPDPVAVAHVVVRSQATGADVPGAQRAIARGEIIDVADVAPAAPDGGGRMIVVALDDSEAAAEEGHATCGVEQPAAGELADLIAHLDG